jgi:predicted ATPase/DNA-binding SARP family transcriptional activator
MAALTIRLLGTFQVSLDGQPVTDLGSRACALLAYLGVESGRPHPRAALAHLLWPDQPQRAALHSLRQALVALRRAIGDQDAQPPFLLITRQAIQLNPHGDCWLDVVAFERQCTTGQEQIQCQQQLTELYRGDFMADFILRDNVDFEEWLMMYREQYYRQALEALESLAVYYEQRAEYEQAIHYARRQIELAPWQERAHRQVMRCLAQLGQRNTALAQYETCRLLLSRELDVEPTQETTALYENIRAGAVQNAPQLPANPRAQGAPAALNSPPPSNLPAPLTPFVGRKKQLAQIADYMTGPDCRLLTLLGPGGVGKTRLALQAAAQISAAFDDGVFFVPLADVEDAQQLAPVIRDVLGLSADDSLSAEHSLRDYLRPRQTLLLLDNLERLPDGAPLLVELLQAAPRLKILVTSQAHLNLQSEWLMRVEPLPFPSSRNERWEQAGQGWDSMRLFVQRARQVEANFDLSSATGPGVARLCRLVEGLPLAIELVAARMNTYSPAALAHELERSPEQLATTRQDVPPRQRSLQALFDYSWELLQASERALLQRLVVFRGSFDVEAAMTIAGATPAALAALASKSVLRRAPDGRYTLPRLLRQCADKKLQADPAQRETLYQRHCAYYAALVQQKEPDLRPNPHPQTLAAIDVELKNARAAWRRALAPGKAPSIAVIERLQPGLFRYFDARGSFRQGLECFGHAAERLERWQAAQESNSGAKLLALLLRRQGHFADAGGDYALAVTAARRAVELSAQAGDQAGQVEGYIAWGQALCGQERHQAAQAPLERALALAREINYGFGEAHSLFLLAGVYRRQGNDSQALECYQRALALYRSANHRHNKAHLLITLGQVHRFLGDYASAQYHLEQARAIHRAAGNRLGEALALENLGALYSSLGDYKTGQGYYEQALALCRQIGHTAKEAGNLEQLSLLHHHQGQHEAAHTCSQQALDLNRELADQAGQAHSLTCLARALAAQGNLPAAADAHQQAIRLRRDAPHLDDLLGLAHVAQAQGNNARALALVDETLARVETAGAGSVENRPQFYLNCYRILRASAGGQQGSAARAQALLATAHAELQEQAARIEDEALRRRYLENVPLHREIVSEWRVARGGPPKDGTQINTDFPDTCTLRSRKC